MYTELITRQSNSAIQKLYELQSPINGYEMVIVSCKPNGADGLKGSFFIWGTNDGDTIERELAWDTEDCDFNHEQVLMDLIGKHIKENDLPIYGKDYHTWRDGKYTGVATYTDDPNVGDSFLRTSINDTNEEVFEVHIPQKWVFA